MARNAGGTLAVKLAGVALVLGANVVLARVMGVDNFGVYATVISWLGLLVLVGTLGLHTAALRFVATYKVNEQWALLRGMTVYSRRMVLLGCAAVGVALVGTLFTLGERLSEDLSRTFMIAAAVLPLVGAALLCQNTLRALGRVVLGQLPITICRPAMLAVLGGGAYLALGRRLAGSEAMWLCLAASAGVLALGAWWVRKNMPPQCASGDTELQRGRWLATGLPLALTGGFYILNLRCGVYMLSAMAGTTQAGIYAQAARLAELLGFGLFAANQGAASMIAELHAEGRRDELQAMLRTMARGVLAISLPAAAVLVLAGRFALGLFGPEFVVAYVPLLVLAGGQLVNTLNAGGGFLMTMTGHEKSAVVLIAISSTVNVALSAVLIPRMGLLGAATAATAAAIVWNVLLLSFSLRRLHINPTVWSRKEKEKEEQIPQ